LEPTLIHDDRGWFQIPFNIQEIRDLGLALYPPNKTPPISKTSPSLSSGITDSYVFANFLHSSIPGQHFLKDIRICQKLHARENGQQKFKILEHIKSVCFCSFYNTVDISTRFSAFRHIAEQPVLSAHCKRSDSVFCYVI